MVKLKDFVKKNYLLIGLFAYCCAFFIVSAKMNLFWYRELAFGKFDLGNMVQMVWNTMHGRFMYLTDYFGTDMPRWGMSHVDPIIVLLVPFFFIAPHPLTLVFCQLFLLVATSLLLFYLANMKLKTKTSAFFLALSYLFYPALGYLTTKTSFHGVSVSIFFFVAAFFLFEIMHEKQDFSRKNLILFWILLIITMSGKEQVPLYIFLYGLFIWIYRKKKVLGLWVSGVGFLWFALAFFVIIPSAAHYRIDGFEKFAESLDLSKDRGQDVTSSNYFLTRYSAFGDTYSEVLLGMATKPALVYDTFFAGSKTDDFVKTLAPVLFTPFLSPGIFAIAGPDFLINYLSSMDNVYRTSAIDTHRISMLIPVIFVSMIFSVKFLADFLSKRQKKLNFASIGVIISAVILLANIYTSVIYDNPVYAWGIQAIRKRLEFKVFARTAKSEDGFENLEPGQLVKFQQPDSRDLDCSWRIINMMPPEVSISGPDYMGAPLSMRKTYAIFPALYNTADYVIADSSARKLQTIVGADDSMLHRALSFLIKTDLYEPVTACGNLFVYRRTDLGGALPSMEDISEPLLETDTYAEKVDYPFYDELSLVDYDIPSSLVRGIFSDLTFVYAKRASDYMGDVFIYTSFINEATKEMYQVANLPSHSFIPLSKWDRDKYYLEKIKVSIPESFDIGNYRVFVGATNNIKTRNLFLGTVEVL